jgi:pimeloyl-ACP methyl ester carboxylesterase
LDFLFLNLNLFEISDLRFDISPLHPSPMRTLTLPGVELALADHGAGRPVVLIHGFPMDHSIWSEQVQSLARHYRVITPDLRGLGRSSITSGKVSVEQWADDLAAMLDALKITERIVLGGLSMGGYVAFRFFQAHRARLAGLILCDTKAAADTPQAAAGRLETAQRVQREGARFLADAMLPRLLAPATLARQAEVADRLRQIILAGDPAGYAATSRGLAERPDFTPLLPRIDCPTLLIVGRQDAISTVAEMNAMARAIPGSRIVEIEAAGHVTPLEAPAEVSAAMEEFLLGVTAGLSSTGS